MELYKNFKAITELMIEILADFEKDLEKEKVSKEFINATKFLSFPNDFKGLESIYEDSIKYREYPVSKDSKDAETYAHVGSHRQFITHNLLYDEFLMRGEIAFSIPMIGKRILPYFIECPELCEVAGIDLEALKSKEDKYQWLTTTNHYISNLCYLKGKRTKILKRYKFQNKNTLWFIYTDEFMKEFMETDKSLINYRRTLKKFGAKIDKDFFGGWSHSLLKLHYIKNFNHPLTRIH